ncbi:hypothetical protein V1515DRAFT_618233 [Lipomyces mesembrius]
MDIVVESSTNVRRSLSRARSTTALNSPGLSDHSLEFSRSPTEGSSTTSDTVSTDMSPQKDENALSDYDKALGLLKNNPSEQRLKYLKLEESWSKIRLARKISEDQKYPYLAYNSAAEIVTVVTVPRALHEDPALELGRMVVDGAREYLSSHGVDASLVHSIHNAGSTTFKETADGTILYTPLGGLSKIMIAKDYTALCRSKDQWIEGRHVKICVLVCLDESPRFRNPRTLNESVGDIEAEMETMGRSMAESVIRDHLQSYYGYIEYRGHKWVGDLKEAFIEQLLQNAWSCHRLPKTIGLKVSDFVPDEEWKTANIPDSSLSFDAILYVDILRRSMQTTAEERYREFISP